MDYSTEPEEIFFPLSAERYCEFYDIEMTDFDADLEFYLSALGEQKNILELGCGSGRLSRALAARGHRLTGLDISLEMLARAQARDTATTYVHGDMTRFSLQKRFDVIIIPYNTLNLLTEPGRVKQCLQHSRDHLRKDGLLLLQIFLPENTTLATGDTRTFQFQIFTTPEGGKIIKETLKSYQKENQRLTLRERYRVRPGQGEGKTEDLAHSLDLLALPHADWVRLIRGVGFTIGKEYGDYTLFPFVEGRDSRLLLTAKAG